MLIDLHEPALSKNMVRIWPVDLPRGRLAPRWSTHIAAVEPPLAGAPQIAHHASTRWALSNFARNGGGAQQAVASELAT